MLIRYTQKDCLFRAGAIGLLDNLTSWKKFKANEPVEVEDGIANKLIKKGYCEAVKVAKPKQKHTKKEIEE